MSEYECQIYDKTREHDELKDGHLFEELFLRKVPEEIRCTNRRYLPYKEAMRQVRDNQPWDLTDPDLKAECLEKMAYYIMNDFRNQDKRPEQFIVPLPTKGPAL